MTTHSPTVGRRKSVKKRVEKEYSEKVDSYEGSATRKVEQRLQVKKNKEEEQEGVLVSEIVNGLNLDEEEIKEIEEEYIGNECTVTVYPGEESTRTQSFFQSEKVYDLSNEKDFKKQKEIIKEARRLAMSGKDATYTFFYLFI
ncbi:hypothetical protein RFI_24494 [Reticulomyxa filosa]|uniref:Uncharacterized protein n=1 Tax=Reticulomyxa filosa TaxID=46433 RepID=X6MFW9_RETFI|nr:hypothetical protein RFI_24494 [Reticulomyxa filosa]|eukprot:ETO12883.1 hypothetical protein RFI_24494 [Reticulomyxa filosa]